jgi:hypothetical protein
VDGATSNEEPRRTAATVAETTKVAARRRLLQAEVGTVAVEVSPNVGARDRHTVYIYKTGERTIKTVRRKKY